MNVYAIKYLIWKIMFARDAVKIVLDIHQIPQTKYVNAINIQSNKKVHVFNVVQMNKHKIMKLANVNKIVLEQMAFVPKNILYLNTDQI